MYAVFQTGGKQFRAEEGNHLRVPSLDVEPGERITFDEVLLTSNGDDVTIGEPTVKGASVEAEVVDHGRTKKIIVYKKKRRKRYRRKQGHRQKYTEIRIEAIST